MMVSQQVTMAIIDILPDPKAGRAKYMEFRKTIAVLDQFAGWTHSQTLTGQAAFVGQRASVHAVNAGDVRLWQSFAQATLPKPKSQS